MATFNKDSDFDWVSGKFAHRADERWAKETMASPRGKAAKEALKGALAEQKVTQQPSRKAKMVKLVAAAKLNGDQVDTRPDAGQRAPDVDPSLSYTDPHKAYIRAEQTAALSNVSWDGQYDLDVMEDLDALGSIIVAESAPAVPESRAAARRKEKELLETLDDEEKFDELMTLPQDSGEIAWSVLDHERRLEVGASLREEGLPAPFPVMDPAGLNLSARPPPRPVRSSGPPPPSSGQRRGGRRRIPTAKKAELDGSEIAG